MRKLIFAVSCLLSGLSYGQISIDTTININQLGYDPVELGNNTSESLKKMTEEEKVWFTSTFIHRRGQFKIPEEPIVDPFDKK
jgi:hypothetical protein